MAYWNNAPTNRAAWPGHHLPAFAASLCTSSVSGPAGVALLPLCSLPGQRPAPRCPSPPRRPLLVARRRTEGRPAAPRGAKPRHSHAWARWPFIFSSTDGSKPHARAERLSVRRLAPWGHQEPPGALLLFLPHFPPSLRVILIDLLRGCSSLAKERPPSSADSLPAGISKDGGVGDCQAPRLTRRRAGSEPRELGCRPAAPCPDGDACPLSAVTFQSAGLLWLRSRSQM